jgi:hypothetical protein
MQVRRRYKLGVILRHAVEGTGGRGFRSVRLSILNIGAKLGWAINATPGDLFPLRRPNTQCRVHDIGPGRILKIVSASGFKPRTAQPVASCHTD